MKSKLFLLLFILPAVLFAQNSDRGGWYGNAGLGYGMYTLDIYNYNSGNNGLYANQKLSNMLVWVGAERKSAWQSNNLVFDAGGELTIGLGVTNQLVKSGNPSGTDISGGWGLGIRGLVKVGYLLGSGSIVPLLGVGPYYSFINSDNGDDDNSGGNQIYGLQGYAGVDFQFGKFVLTPQINFGLASWGWSDIYTGANVDNNELEGSPALFEIGAKIAVKF
jgi:hypothetical protein